MFRRARRRVQRLAPARKERPRLFAAVDELGIVVMFGELHADGCTIFRQATTSPDAMPPLRIDLAAVTSTDAAGAQLLLEADEHERQHGRTLELLNVSPQLADVLRSAGLTDRADTDGAVVTLRHAAG